LPNFCRAFLGWPDTPISHRARVNESFTMVDHELIRALNVVEWTMNRDDQKALADSFMAAKDDLPIDQLIDEAMQFNVETLRIDDAAPGLAELHANLASLYRAAAVEPCPERGFFQPRAVDTLYVRPDYLMGEGVIETLRGMHQKLLAGQDADYTSALKA
jgi:hypothetical protein